MNIRLLNIIDRHFVPLLSGRGWGWVFLLTFLPLSVAAQDVIVKPEISYAGTPRQCEIGGIAVEGVEGYEDYVLINLSGLSVGQQISVPGAEITDAVNRYWKHGLFSRVSISADSIVGSKIYLRFKLGIRPRVSTINYNGVKKSERVGNSCTALTYSVGNNFLSEIIFIN